MQNPVVFDVSYSTVVGYDLRCRTVFFPGLQDNVKKGLNLDTRISPATAPHSFHLLLTYSSSLECVSLLTYSGSLKVSVCAAVMRKAKSVAAAHLGDAQGDAPKAGHSSENGKSAGPKPASGD